MSPSLLGVCVCDVWVSVAVWALMTIRGLPMAAWVLMVCVVNVWVQEPLFGMLTAPLELSLTRTDAESKQRSLDVFILVNTQSTQHNV